MAEFVAFDPKVESKGAAILATLAGLEFDITPLLSKHGLQDITPDGWYSQQAWLDLLREINSMPHSNSLQLVSIGMRIPETADWPPDVNTLDDALFSINVAYHMNHRGGEIGSYLAERLDDQHIRVTCENPFPSDFDYGIIYGVTRLYAKGRGFTVERAASPSRKNGDNMCRYDVYLE